MAVTIIHRAPPAPPQPLSASALDGVPGVEDIFALLALLHSPDAGQRYRARRLLRMHVQVMQLVPARKDAIAYIEQELDNHPNLHP